jgi:hypothetical protein
MKYEGRPRTEVEVNDLSVIFKGGVKGIVAVAGETERGEFDISRLITTWTMFRKYYGDLGENWNTPNATIFPLLCKRIIDAGGAIRVARMQHYADPSDNTSGTAVKGTLTLADIVFTAKTAGDFACKVAIDPAADGTAGEYDIAVTLSGFPELDFTYPNMPEVITQVLADKFNAMSEYVGIAPGTIVLTVAGTGESGDLAGGAYDTSAIVDTDYIGDKYASTGIYVFDEFEDFNRIAIPHRSSPAVDLELSAYVTNRRNTVRAILKAPAEITGYGAVDYRKGEGVYSHTPVDNHLCSMVFGDIKLKHPLTGADMNVPAIADALGLKAKRDNLVGEWFASAGQAYPIPDALGVYYNLGTSARADEYDEVSNAGINSVINHKDFGVVPYDNRTLQKKATLLSHENVSELIVHMVRTIKPLAESVTFQPNDVETWRAVYRRVTPFMDTLVEGRAIWDDYLYQGDQDADTIDDAIINSPEDIDAGGYKFKIAFKPKVALKYINIVFNITNSGVDLESIGV